METVKKRNEARMHMIHNPSHENQERYKHLKEFTNKTIHHLNYQCQSINKLYNKLLINTVVLQMYVIINV